MNQSKKWLNKKITRFGAKLLSTVIAFIIVTALLPATVFAAEETGTSPSKLWVNGVDIVADADNTVACGDGTVVYDASENILTLTNATIHTPEGTRNSGVLAETGDLQVVLEGTNVIGMEGTSSFYFGIYARNGNASVSSTSGATLNIYLTAPSNQDNSVVGIKSKNFSLDDVNLTVKGNSGSTRAWNAIQASNDITVSNSTVTASVLKEGIGTLFNNITISDSQITITDVEGGINAGENLSISSASIVNADAEFCALIAQKAMVLADSTIAATSTADSAIYTPDALTISGTADVTATGKLRGLQSGGELTISGGTVHAKSTNGDGAIGARSIQADAEDPTAHLTVSDQLAEKNGGQLSVSDWFMSTGNNTNRSWTSFIPKGGDKLEVNADGTMKNALSEVWLSVPHTVTFDVNGGSGANSTVKVYPGNKVAAPAAVPAKDGCHFSGWYLGETKFDFANTPVTGEMTLKAKFDAHTWNAGEITTPATSVQEGVKTYACTVCGQTKTEAIPKLPLSSTLVDNSTGTKVEYENGSVFDANIVLNVTSKPQAEMDKFKDSVSKTAPGLILGGLYDVKLLKDGVVIQPDGNIKVSIPLTENLKAMTGLKVVYIDDNGKVTVIPSQIVDGKIVFITNHFSYYGVIGVPNNTPQTGDSSQMVLWVGLLFISGSALVLFGFAKKQKGK